MITVKNKIKWYPIVVLLTISCMYCTRYDDYKKFMPEGEIIYPQKPDSLRTFPGKYRILLEWVIVDPKVTSCIIFYEQGGIQDTTAVTINEREGNYVNDTVRIFMPNLEEAVYSFRIVSYDDFGNVSIPVEIEEMAYGDAYERTRMNRVARNAMFTLEGALSIEWYDPEESEIGVNLFYTDINGVKKTKIVDKSEIFTEVYDFDFDEPLFYNTMYKPVAACIDTFYSQTAEQSVRRQESVNITADVLKNYEMPFLRGDVHSHNGRYFKALNWEYDESSGVVQNGNIDGWLNDPLLIMASTHDDWYGQKVVNGKLYQTVELEAGTYTFEVLVIETDYPDNAEFAQAYIVAALGENLPNTDDVHLALASFAPPAGITRNGEDELCSIEFVLYEKTTVSLGIVVSFQPPAAATIYQIHFRKFDLWWK